MWTLIILLAAIWLLISPYALGFAGALMWTSIGAGVLVTVLRPAGGGGAGRYYGISAVGIYLAIISFLTGGAPALSCLIAGLVLVFAGFMAGRTVDRETTTAGAV